MQHILIQDPGLQGKEYGTLRSFEQAIIQQTDAETFSLPPHRLPPAIMKHFLHGMTRAKYRSYFPKQTIAPVADVAWYILMGPENYQLDLFNGWQKSCKTKILYLFDTLPAQYPLIKKLFSNNDWDILITSFNDAAADLEKITKRKWHVLPQATNTDFFKPVPFNERLNHFSAFGRRNHFVHNATKHYCESKGLHYEYTMAASWDDQLSGMDLYRHYAWQLNHSLFTFCWPVEQTSPTRAGHLHPITCRWFESAAAGAVMLGAKPANEIFDQWLFPDAVQPVNGTESSMDAITAQLDAHWNNRQQLHEYAAKMQNENIQRWSWQERVGQVLKWI